MAAVRKVFVLVGDHAGGLEHRIFQLFEHLYVNGKREWYLIASDRLVNRLRNEGDEHLSSHILTYRQSKSGITTMVDVGRILLILRKSKFDVAILYEAIVKAAFLYWPFVKRIYISVVNPFDFLNENRTRIHAFGYALSFRLYKSRIDALSPIIRDYLIERMKFLRKVEIAPFTFSPFENDVLGYIGAEKMNYVVWAGSFHDGKDPFFFLNVIHRLRELLLEMGIRVIFAGRGELESSMRTFISDNGLEKMVEIRYYGNVREILKNSKLFISTQRVTNYPSRVLLEAYTLNNRIICLDTGDTAMFKNFIDIDIVSPDNFESVFSEAISNMSNATPKNSLKGIEDGNLKFIEWFLNYYK